MNKALDKIRILASQQQTRLTLTQLINGQNNINPTMIQFTHSHNLSKDDNLLDFDLISNNIKAIEITNNKG